MIEACSRATGLELPILTSAAVGRAAVECPYRGDDPIGAMLAREDARRSHPEQHRDHHQVAGAERAIEPVGLAEAKRQRLQPTADAIRDERQALGAPGLVALEELGIREFEDGWL